MNILGANGRLPESIRKFETNIREFMIQHDCESVDSIRNISDDRLNEITLQLKRLPVSLEDVSRGVTRKIEN